MNPLISIIIPVYKVEDFLCITLDSVLAQTFEAWECILVDDGSPDGSGIICDEYAKKDHHFKVIHKKNEGVSIARNTGIKAGKGDWIVFLDGDDTWDASMLSELAEKIYNNRDVQMFSFGYKYIKSGNADIERVFKKGKCNGQKLFDRFYQDGAWAYLYKRELIEKWKVEFPPGIRYSEDQCFTCKYLLNNPMCYIIDKVYYNYYYREDSACGRTKTINDYADNLRAAVDIAKYANIRKCTTVDFVYSIIRRFFSLFLWYIVRLESYDHKLAVALYRDAYREIVKQNFRFFKNVRLLLCYFLLNRYIKHLKQKSNNHVKIT